MSDLHERANGRDANDDTKWNLCGQSNARQCIIYFSQLAVILIVIIIAGINLTLGRGNSELWASLLSACLGYILPSPSLNRKD